MKAILIEDRKERQNLFIKEFKFDLNGYEDVLYNATDKKYEKIYEELKKENYHFLNDYDVIISHKSAFEGDNSSIIFRLENFAKNNNKKLIFFSGGIDTVYYYKENEFEHLELNSMIFYSKNLKMFLDELKNNKLHILILAYGKKWKVNIFIEVLDKLAYFIEIKNKDKFLFRNFSKRIELEKLKEFGFDFSFDKKEITKNEMIELKYKLAEYIEEMVKYESYNS